MTASPTARLAVLLVDDEPAIRRALESALRLWGHTVYVADNGEDAI